MVSTDLLSLSLSSIASSPRTRWVELRRSALARPERRRRRWWSSALTRSYCPRGGSWRPAWWWPPSRWALTTSPRTPWALSCTLSRCVCVWSSVSSGWDNPASYDMFLYVLKNKCTAVYLKRNKFYYYVCLNYPSCCSGAFKRPHHRSGVSEKSLPSERGTFPVRLRQWRRTAAVPEEQPGCVPHRHRIVSHFTVFSF